MQHAGHVEKMKSRIVLFWLSLLYSTTQNTWTFEAKQTTKLGYFIGYRAGQGTFDHLVHRVSIPLFIVATGSFELIYGL